MKAENIQFQNFRCGLFSALVLGAISQPLSAATFTWDGVGGPDANWSTKQNWTSNTAPSGTGHDIVFSGTSRLDNTNDALTSVNSIAFDNTSGAFILSGAALTLTSSITNNSTSLQTINMALGLNATITVAATSGEIAIAGQISGSNGINKQGANNLILTAANIYSGTTTITTGTLLANNASGSATGTGAVSVTGTLGGTGTIAQTGSNGITVNSGGVIAPGDGATPSTLTFNFTSTTGKLTMASGSGFAFHLGSAGMGDMLAIVGATAGDVAFNNNVINFMNTGSLGSYKLFDTDSNNANTWTGLTVNGSGQITNGLTASNLANGYTAVFYMGGSTYGGTTGDIYVQVIPEPKAALLGCIGVLLLFRRRRD